MAKEKHINRHIVAQQNKKTCHISKLYMQTHTDTHLHKHQATTYSIK